MINGSTDKHAHLIPLLKAGNEGAFGALYDAYAPMLYGVILRIVGDPKEAENLIQDCFIKIWRNIGLYDPGKGRLATWLMNIARNTAIDFTRSKYYQQKLKIQDVENLVHQENRHLTTVPCIETLGLKQLLDHLTPVCREVIEWMYYKGYTQQEIAEEFNIPLGTVKSRTRLALKELRSYYHYANSDIN